MSILSDQNIEFITRRINESKIESVGMIEDLIDHFCCAVEEEMKKGKSFESSYEKALNDICPDGFNEILNETVFLLSTKKNKAMKQLLYFSGYLSAIGISTTLFMKLSHIAGGQIAFLLTAAILAFLFLPVLFINLYKRDLTKSISDKLKYVSGFLGVVLLLAFSVFKLCHWPGTTIIFLLSLAIINFVFFPLLFFKMYSKSVKL